MLITIAPKTVLQKPVTVKPEISPEAILSISAFIRKVKRPNVIILIGSVKISRTGLKNILSNPITAAAKNAEKNPVT